MKSVHAFISLITQLLLYPDGAVGAAVADVNSTVARPDLNEEAWPEGELPEQMGGTNITLMPGIDVFVLPANLPQLWTEKEIEDGRTKQKVKRQTLKFDRNNPLVVQGGRYDGQPFRSTFTTNPRPRGKKDDPNTAWVSDLAYMLEISIGDRSRPKTANELKARLNMYAGKPIRLEHGLSGQCRQDKVRRIIVEVANPNYKADQPVSDANKPTIQQTIQDPKGTKGCGLRYYTKDFENPEAAEGEERYDLEIGCDCGAVVRGYENVERFLPPMGAGPTPNSAAAVAGVAAGGTGAGRV